MCLEENHLITAPAILLEMLKDFTKGGTMIADLPLSIEFKVYPTQESDNEAVTVYKGRWIKTTDFIKMLYFLEGYDLSPIRTLDMTYVSGLIGPYMGGISQTSESYYSVHLKLH